MQSIPKLPEHIIKQALQIAFTEDWGISGDITSSSCISPDVQVSAELRVRNNQVLNNHTSTYSIAGLELAKSAFLYENKQLQVQLYQSDGSIVDTNTLLAKIYGPALLLLSRERVALNYLCHLSGIASITKQYTQAISHTKARITDTRKTTPGLRALEKFAVRCGGGYNHRVGMFDGIMIKDNHIAATGGIIPALRLAKQNCGHMVTIELELDTLEQLYQLDLDNIELRPDCVLLDNMSLIDLKKATEYIDGRVLCEASGNINLEQVAKVAETGVDLISVGAITHSAPILDIGLDFSIPIR